MSTRTRRFRSLALTMSLIAMLLLSGAVYGPGTCGPVAGPSGPGPDAAGTAVDPIRGAWMSTDFQVINLSPKTEPITARFVSPDGQEVLSFTVSLSGGAADYFAPSLSEFTGTLILETNGQAAMGIVHLREPGDPGGNAIFPGVLDEEVGGRAFLPVDPCTIVLIHNLSPSSTVFGAMGIFDLLGSLLQNIPLSIPAHGLKAIDIRGLGLPLLSGLATVVANGPVEVTVRLSCSNVGELSTLVAPSAGHTLLVAPRIPPNIPTEVTTTLTLQNTTASLVTATITYCSGLAEQVFLEPLGGVVITSPFTATGGAAKIVAGAPIVAFVRSESTVAGNYDTYSYAAFTPPEATSAVALPVLFSGYEGWHTGGSIWVKNAGLAPAHVVIRYVTAPPGDVSWDRQTVEPGEVGRFVMPPMAAERASAILLADQPIYALSGAYNPDDPVDPYISYRGTNFDFQCEQVAGADFSWEPLSPVLGQAVTLTAWVNGSYWATETVDGAGDVGVSTDMALDSAGRPHISYVDDAGNLRYAWFDGYSWHTQTVDGSGGVSGDTSLALDAQDRPHISYHANGMLRCAQSNGNAWSSEVVDATNGTGVYNSLALDSQGNEHISYLRNGALWYAHHTALGWVKALVDNSSSCGQFNSLALSSAGEPHIAYCDMDGLRLRYAYSDGLFWHKATVDDTGALCGDIALAIDAYDRPQISYYWHQDLPAGGDLRFARFDGTDWITETVDSAGAVGLYNSLALNPNNRPHIAYYDETNGDLKHAWYDGASWTIWTVDGAGDVGRYAAVAVDGSNLPRIAYYDASHGDLDYARLVLPPTPPFSFLWGFGDGHASGGQTVAHTYAAPGTYTVTLFVANCLGFGTVTATHALTVTCEPAQIITVTPAISGCLGVFSAEATGTPPLSYHWDFGRFGSSPALTPSVDFGTTGSYPYTLTVANCANTAEDTFWGTVAVSCAPHCVSPEGVEMTWSPPSPQAGQPVDFQGFALGSPPLTFTWDLGDGGSAVGPTVTHTYLLGGEYTVTLTVSNPCGSAGKSEKLTVAPGAQQWRLYLPLVDKGSVP